VCDVHLDPEINELRVASAKGLKCGECRRAIKVGVTYRFIEGPLDDGSGQRYRYIAHDDCFTLSESDSGSDGCFTFGGATIVT
jgi:hypothetical protein